MAAVNELDLYDLLGINFAATSKEVISAYRKKALKCHPDKNPDNAKAAEEFHLLSKALEILTDETARTAYDKIFRAREAAKIRHRDLDSKRKKQKDDLEAREKLAQQVKESEKEAYHDLEKEIERLRSEGSKLLEQEQELLKQQLAEQMEADVRAEENSLNLLPRLKVKWKCDKHDPKNGGYSDTRLKEMFSKYGEVSHIILSSKRSGSAIVEFTSNQAADAAYKLETGSKNNRLKLSWIQGRPDESRKKDDVVLPPRSSPPRVNDMQQSHARDYESLVLTRLRQAEERKKLIAQMQEEEERKMAT